MRHATDRETAGEQTPFGYYDDWDQVLAARGNDSPHTAATFKFHKKAKLLGSARAKGVPEDSLPLLKHRFVKGALAGWGAPPRPPCRRTWLGMNSSTRPLTRTCR